MDVPGLYFTPFGKYYKLMLTTSRFSQSSDSPNTKPRRDNMLIEFYKGSGVDARGRRLNDIMRWKADKLESSHDYIQTLFPLPEGSMFNSSASIVDKEVFEAFRGDAELRDRLKESFGKILWFYGFKMEEEDGKVMVRFLYPQQELAIDCPRSSQNQVFHAMSSIGTRDSTITIFASLESSVASAFWVWKRRLSLSTQQLLDPVESALHPKCTGLALLVSPRFGRTPTLSSQSNIYSTPSQSQPRS